MQNTLVHDREISFVFSEVRGQISGQKSPKTLSDDRERYVELRQVFRESLLAIVEEDENNQKSVRVIFPEHAENISAMDAMLVAEQGLGYFRGSVCEVSRNEFICRPEAA